MKNWIGILLCCASSISGYAGWTVSTAQSIPEASSASSNVYASCNTKTGECLATWVSLNSPYYANYAFYTPKAGWGETGPISTETVNEALLILNQAGQP